MVDALVKLIFEVPQGMLLSDILDGLSGLRHPVQSIFGVVDDLAQLMFARCLTFCVVDDRMS